ncbi:hypothetical protein COV24_04335 [candidate division WWE3 bacterium CG10_big_fil_rev_8_21_14_0_10_32_10]|uniref:2TM domain-containing protein n=1 Tax=candidate division WWE3 bacterium CG10_big_fil_rev_8_21_14_0_10_32_10 TaxID=1975090 RepID=A0A2H0RAR4_UNCKA|nr:MAG: hypothetical protein COV24_04335 [candidate division WWE3 bacterium CG10_big_fil_rev_8_21_14_0_10_32_10]
MFKEYNLEIKKVLSSKSAADWKIILEKHKLMIARIQHERIIHLLVTIFVGIVFSIISIVIIVTKESILVALWIPILFLFFGYLIHYRFLENTTQSWYILEDKIIEKIKL